MNPPAALVQKPSATNEPGIPPAWRPRLKMLAMLAGALALAYGLVLYDLARLSLKYDLYSHVLLIPAITAYLAWTNRVRWPDTFQPAGFIKWVPAAVGAAILVLYFAGAFGPKLPAQDRVAWLTLSFICFIWSASLHSLGLQFCRRMLFPLAFLIFTVPFTTGLEYAIETVLQHGSAHVSYWFIHLSGTPILRDGLIFKLPNISLQVAPECSGIRSSLVLFITALLAGYFFLQRTSSKVFFGTLVVGLGIVRNAFRIFVLAMLCVHVDPDFIRSALHKRGGPVFFALSLIPFFVILWWLRRRERRSREKAEKLKS